MLTITIPGAEFWDEANEEFIYLDDQVLCLEHSLVSLSKWESKWNKAFLGKQSKTDEEILDYIKCMTMNNVNPDIYTRLTSANYAEIDAYIEAPMTATTFYENNKSGGKKSNDTITSELIYYWMISLNIPVEFQEWHLNKLLTLIRVCGVKNSSPKKMNKKDILKQNAALNQARRAKLNSKG